MTYQQATVEIRSVPHGEAPFRVREKWVGLKLPTVLQEGSPVSARTFGVLSGPRTWLAQFRAFVCGRTKREFGFVVPVLPAMHALEKCSPKAASWWRENASHLMQPVPALYSRRRAAAFAKIRGEFNRRTRPPWKIPGEAVH